MSTLDTLGFSLMIQRRGESNPELSVHFSIHYDDHDILKHIQLMLVIAFTSLADIITSLDGVLFKKSSAKKFNMVH